jgi:ABC-type glycerol-3-phosphate transport system substrate-binding protein
MSNVTSFPEEPRSSVGHAAARALAWFARPDVLALLLLAVLTVFRVQGTVDQDTSWQLWVADRLHHGARLYSDIMETNPPLWFWMALPVDSLAKLLGVRSDALMILAVAAAAALSLVATGPSADACIGR